LVKKHSRKQYSAVIQKALDYIDFHFEQQLSLDFLANHLSVSNAYLSSLFKKEVGDTITNYINQTRVRHAIHLLTNTTKSIQEISEECGFNDANYFTRTFKKFQGVSAKSYRKNDET
ncbi:MAG: helix-turn-helix domain-containing protein, partial [Anaerotignaceae bacterium]